MVFCYTLFVAFCVAKKYENEHLNLKKIDIAHA